MEVDKVDRVWINLRNLSIAVVGGGELNLSFRSVQVSLLGGGALPVWEDFRVSKAILGDTVGVPAAAEACVTDSMA